MTFDVLVFQTSHSSYRLLLLTFVLQALGLKQSVLSVNDVSQYNDFEVDNFL